ncbi:MAG: ImmA/IrrE family metallo-endopeptidase [Phycisphaerales bacterium]
MENQFLDRDNAADIDQSVTKILSDLGNPDPPLNLSEVRELLRLDRVYYSSTDQGMLGETVHRLKVAGKQIMKRPSLLVDAIKKFDLSALWLPDRKRILIDREMPILKQRWGEAHEIGHSMIPWHEPLMHGDQQRTLSITCHQQIEKEANYAAGRLLFLQDRFADEVRSSDVDFKRIRTLHKTYGNTLAYNRITGYSRCGPRQHSSTRRARAQL